MQPTQKGRLYGHVPDCVEFRVIAPLPSRVVEAITEFSSFVVALSTRFDAALAYVVSGHMCEIELRSVPSSWYPHFVLYFEAYDRQWPLAVDCPVKQAEDCTEYGVPRQQVSRATWHAFDYGMVDRATVLARE